MHIVQILTVVEALAIISAFVVLPVAFVAWDTNRPERKAARAARELVMRPPPRTPDWR